MPLKRRLKNSDDCRDGNKKHAKSMKKQYKFLEEADWYDDKDDYIDEIVEECIDGDEGDL